MVILLHDRSKLFINYCKVKLKLIIDYFKNYMTSNTYYNINKYKVKGDKQIQSMIFKLEINSKALLSKNKF